MFEKNLMWSSKLLQSLRGLGHEALLADSVQPADVAIVNLSDQPSRELIVGLRAAGVRVVGHAGHKETQLHEAGHELGVDLMVTNSELTFKIEETLASVLSPRT